MIENKTEYIIFRVTKFEKERLREIAREQGKTLSQFLRDSIKTIFEGWENGRN